MDLEKQLKELRSIKGYVASSILSWTGDALAADTVDATLDAPLLATMCNDVFNSAHECASRIDPGGECKETIVTTPTAVVILRCSGKSSRAHFHIGCILSKDGNQALARMMLDKLMKNVTPFFA